jgi:hypothetical protein
MIPLLALSTLVIAYILGISKTMKDAREIDGEDVFTDVDELGNFKKQHESVES